MADNPKIYGEKEIMNETYYSENEDLNKILNDAEKLLVEFIGRYEARRFIGLFNEEPLNLFNKIYNLGKK